MTTFFAKADPKFVIPAEDGSVATEPFLNASKEIVPFFDIMGTAFKPVKSDIEGNINRLIKRYKSDPSKYPTLRHIVDEEVERKCCENKDSATQAILWYKRALEYILMFLKQIVEDHKSGTKTENISGFARNAYDNTLKNYHGWFVQKIFGLVSRACPYRKDFLKSLADGQEGLEDQVISDMDEYLQTVDANIKVIHAMLTEMGLDFQNKV